MVDTKGRLRKCFLIAPSGYELESLVHVFDRLGLKVQGLESLSPDRPLVEALAKDLRQVDVVCGVVVADVLQQNQLFELGYAAAMRKRIFLIVEPGLEVPTDLLAYPFIRGNVENATQLEPLIEGMLHQLSRRTTVTKPAKGIRGKPDWDQFIERLRHLSQELPSEHTARAFERWVADLLKAAGIRSSSQEPSPTGPDFAIWVSGIEQSLGNPVLVETKFGNLSPGALEKAADRLRQFLRDGPARAGLLIYCTDAIRKMPSSRPAWPPVLVLRADEFVNALRSENLAQLLISTRNRVAHGME